MATDKEAKDIIDKFIDNVFNFDVLTTERVKEKDAEIKKITTEDMYEKVVYIRPYVGVIQSLNPQQIQYEFFLNNGTDIEAELSFRKVSYLVDRGSIPTDSLSTVTVHLVERNQEILIDYFDEIQDVLYGEYMEEEYLFNEDVPLSTILALELNDAIDSLTNIKYMFKGAPKENPFGTDKDVYIDTYNLLYWLYLSEDEELAYPMNINYFFTEGRFYTVFGKGHKYKVDISKFIAGDILFFGRSDTNIGIYVGDGEFISMIGKFPKDETPIGRYKLDDYWNEFNGRVMRFDEEVYI
ncbi:tail protein [Staphylococcus phage PG-2021_19]